MENVIDYRVRIVTGRYSLAPPEQQQMIRGLLGENAEYYYELYFHWYNVIHELGHAVMMFNATSEPHPAEQEQLVNDFAVAYWRHCGAHGGLHELGAMVDETLGLFDVPARSGESYMEYAKNHWEDESMFDFNNYGWFQFSSVSAALSRMISVEQALHNMRVPGITVRDSAIAEYAICDQMPARVLEDAVRTVRGWGVRLPADIDIAFCSDANCHMCETERISR